MSDIDELPNWAVRSVPPGTVAPSNVTLSPPGEPPRRRRSGLLLALLGLLVVAGLGAGAYWLVNRADDASVATDEPTTATTGADTDTDTGDTAGTGAGSGVAAGATTTTVAAATSTPTSTAAALAPPSSVTSDDIVTDESMITDDNPTGAIRYAVLSQGTLYLRGRVPAAAVGDQIAQIATAVVGPGNVVNEYDIDPTVPVDIPGPLYVEDVVLFGFNSVTVEPAFLPILDLGTLLMTQNPNVKITVVARTDSVGTEATNLEVSRQRAQAVANYWIAQGIDPSRIIADPRGEADAADTTDASAAALDRRAEFIISGLFG